MIPYRGPYDWDAMLSFLRARAIPGVEQVEGGVYRRLVSGVGPVEVSHVRQRQSLAVTACPPDVLERVRRLFDLDADLVRIGSHLAKDPRLAPLVAERPGLRVPGGWDGFELAVRAVLGQQVSVRAGLGLVGQLVRLCGTPNFPTAAEVLATDLTPLRTPGARKAALAAVARATLADPQLFQPLATVDATVARFRGIRGVGEWTAQYIALRAVREADAFPAGDVGLLRAAADRDGVRPSPAALRERAERWRPFRAYAAQHLWAADAARSP